MADNGDKREHTGVEKTCWWDIMIIMGILRIYKDWSKVVQYLKHRQPLERGGWMEKEGEWGILMGLNMRVYLQKYVVVI